MYIDPFIGGILFTVFAEIILLIIYGWWKGDNNGKNNVD